MVHVWNADLDRSRHGYVFYFTVLMAGGRFAEQIKVCENGHGRVTGAADISAANQTARPPTPERTDSGAHRLG
jgi:hypothetical protein